MLARTALLNGVDLKVLETLASRVQFTSARAGEEVISAGTLGQTLYLVIHGTVKIKVDRPDGTEAVIAMLGPGDIVGELSALDAARRSADVVALEPTDLVAMERAVLDELLGRQPVVARNMLRLLSRRVRLSSEQIRALCSLDALGKVARQLLVFAEHYGIESPGGVLVPMRLTQTDIGCMVGASRERTNQVMGVLKRMGLVSVDRSCRVTVHDTEKLSALVQSR